MANEKNNKTDHKIEIVNFQVLLSFHPHTQHITKTLTVLINDRDILSIGKIIQCMLGVCESSSLLV